MGRRRPIAGGTTFPLTMAAPDDLLHDLAGAVLDGAAVDWAAAESSADARIVPFVRHLRLVASVAQVHHDVLETETLDAPAAGRVPESAGQWGHLRLLDRVGAGAFGEVFRAWDPRLDREVALKLLPAAAAPADPGAIIREGRLLAKVRHPNVVTIHGAEQIGDRIGLWMEFVRGQTLEQLLRRGTVFSVAEVIAIGVELCRAVAAVHAAGLLHRDINAHNITRADDGRIVLMDFGAGQEVEDRSADVTGTPLYLAPEVLAGRAPASVRSDIYSLGVLLFYLLTRTYPVHGRTMADMKRAHAGGERLALRTVRSDVRAPVARVIEAAMAPQPEDRPANMDALARDLLALQAHPHRVRRRAAMAAAGVALLLAAGVGVRTWLAREARDVRAGAAGTVPATAPRPFIVVLPFTSRTGDADAERLVDSVTAGLIQQLARIDGIAVVSHETAFRLKGKSRDDVRRLPGVNLILTGDAELSGTTMVIRASLVSTPDQQPIWSEPIGRELRAAGDVMTIVDDITLTIVNRLRLTLPPTQRRYETADLTTLRLYLQARALRDSRGSNIRAAIAVFKQVLDRDPSFAPAMAGLAAAYGSMAVDYPTAEEFSIAPAEAAALVRPLVAEALALDPLLADAHAAKGLIDALARQWTSAEASFRSGIVSDPTRTNVYGDFVLSTLLPWGRHDEAVRLLEDALVADPLSLDLRRVLAVVQISAGRYDEAREHLQRILEERPDFPFVSNQLTRALFFGGRRAEALARLERFSVGRVGVTGWLHAIAGRRAEAEAIAAMFPHLPQRQAEIHGYLGDKDAVFEALSRLAEMNPVRAATYLDYPELAVIRGDDRVAAMRARLGFPQ